MRALRSRLQTKAREDLSDAQEPQFAMKAVAHKSEAVVVAETNAKSDTLLEACELCAHGLPSPLDRIEPLPQGRVRCVVELRSEQAG